MTPDHLGCTDDAVLVHSKRQADEAGVGPRQRRRRPGPFAERQLTGTGGVGSVPYLLGQHQSFIVERHQRVEIRPRIPAARQLVFAALAGEERPEAAHPGAVVAAAVRLLSIAIMVVAIPRW